MKRHELINSAGRLTVREVLPNVELSPLAAGGDGERALFVSPAKRKSLFVRFGNGPGYWGRQLDFQAAANVGNRLAVKRATKTDEFSHGRDFTTLKQKPPP